MKDLTVLVSRYTKSLYSTAKEGGKVADIHNELEKLSDALELSGKYKDIALNPKVPNRVKSVIWATLMDQSKSGEMTRAFVNMMLKNSRVHLFPKVLQKYDSFNMADKGVKGVKLYTSMPITDKDANAITTKLEALLDSKIELQTIVKPEIIGGMIAQFDSYMIDASMQSKLNKLKTTLLS